MFKTVFFISIFIFACSLFASEEREYIQKRSLIIKDGLFYPDNLQMFEGESLHLMVGNFMGHSTCLANEGKKFFINVSPGNVIEQRIKFDDIGDFVFTCPGLKSQMLIQVRPKPLLMEKKPSYANRMPASIPDGVWAPRGSEAQEEW